MSINSSNDHKHCLTSSLNIHCNDCLHFARCQIWVQNSRRQDLLNRSPSYISINCKLCAEHFESSQFTNPSKNRLNWNAVPTLFSVPNPPQKRLPDRHRGFIVMCPRRVSLSDSLAGFYHCFLFHPHFQTVTGASE